MYYVFFLLCCLCLPLCSNTPTHMQPSYIIYPPPTITIYNNTHVDQASTASSKQADSWPCIPEHIRSSLSHFSLEHLPKQCYTFFYQNRLSIIGIVACSNYGIAYIRLRDAHSYLTQNTLWSNWQDDIPTKKLLYMPEQTLVQELILETQQRYRTRNEANHGSPYTMFLKEAAEEMQTIQEYKILYEWLDYVYITRIMMLDMTCFKHIDDKLQRVGYLRNILQRWVAEQQQTT